MTEQAPTHAAFALRKESRQRSRYIEIGHARIEDDGAIHHVFLDRLPVGGFTGHVFLSPIGIALPEPVPQPGRPGESE